jgi:hypothetical protein
LLLLAPTGCAASNIGGITIHSGLGIKENGQPLSDKEAAEFRMRYRHVACVVFDEGGMVGTALMASIAQALVQIFGPCPSAPLLGNVGVVVFGDFAQLPPVKDDPVWAGASWKSSDGGAVAKAGAPAAANAGVVGAVVPPGAALPIGAAAEGSAAQRRAALSAIKVAGRAAWSEVCRSHIKLTHIWRQAPEEQALRGILFRQRDGESSSDDVSLLNSRHKSCLVGQHAPPDELLRNAYVLAQTKAEIAEVNQQAMTDRGTPIHASRARDDGNTVGLTPDAFRGLNRVVFLQAGSRYMLTANLWVDAGLYNGRDCVLHYVVYASEEDKGAGHPVGRMPAALFSYTFAQPLTRSFAGICRRVL